MSQYPSDQAGTACPAIRANEAAELAENLFERYHDEIFAYLQRVVGDREWAQDLAQEAFVSAYRARDHIPGLHNPRAWLYRIATNLALNELKRRRRFAWLPWQWHEDQPASANVAEEVGRQTLVERALATLPPDYRAPLLLYAHHGLRVAEVAEALSLSEGAARMRLQRAREMFRKAYRREEEA